MITILQADARKIPLADASVDCVVTSPPYWGLRDYGVAGQIGLEETPEQYVAALMAVFREVKRVLKPQGTLWLNLGDTYAGSGRGLYGDGTSHGTEGAKQKTNAGSIGVARDLHDDAVEAGALGRAWTAAPEGYKQKDLIGVPWQVAFALRADGWYLRSDIIWAKQNCMPESVTDRPTRSHEYIFLLSKSARYFYDHDAIKEPCIYDVDGTGTAARKARAREGDKGFPTQERAGIRSSGMKDARNFAGEHEDKQRGHSRSHNGFNDRWDKMSRTEQCMGMRNKRDVWTVAPAQFTEAHFATFPEKLIEPCILAGCPKGGTVLDPFCGSGTTLKVAHRLGRSGIGLELNPEYIEIARRRIFADVEPSIAEKKSGQRLLLA